MKLYERLTEETWGKGYVRLDGRGCLTRHFMMDLPTPGERIQAGRAVAEAIRLLYPDRMLPYTTGWVGIGRFSDHPETTIDDVLRVLKFADV